MLNIKSSSNECSSLKSSASDWLNTCGKMTDILTYNEGEVTAVQHHGSSIIYYLHLSPLPAIKYNITCTCISRLFV